MICRPTRIFCVRKSQLILLYVLFYHTRILYCRCELTLRSGMLRAKTKTSAAFRIVLSFITLRVMFCELRTRK